jgi:hypothetical protein
MSYTSYVSYTVLGVMFILRDYEGYSITRRGNAAYTGFKRLVFVLFSEYCVICACLSESGCTRRGAAGQLRVFNLLDLMGLVKGNVR